MDVNNYTLEMRIKYCKDLRLLAEQIEEIKQGIIGEPRALPQSRANRTAYHQGFVRGTAEPTETGSLLQPHCLIATKPFLSPTA